MEPMTIFARIVDVAGVAGLLRQRHPAVVLDGPDHDWRSATVSFGSGKLTLSHDPEYYADPNWSTQIDGLRGYYGRFPDSEAKQSAILLTTTFSFSLGVLLDSNHCEEPDARLETVFAVAKFLDGVIFTTSSLLDAEGRILFGADGEVDPEAVWPVVRAQVTIDSSRNNAASERSPALDEESATAPNAQRVARRALTLTAVAARALLEQKWTVIGPRNSWRPRNWIVRRENQRRDLVEWIDLLDIGDEPEPDEWEVLQRPIGRLDARQQIDSTWRLEGLVVLAWALRLFEMPPHDKLVAPHSLLASMNVLDAPAAKALLAHPSLRSRLEINVMRQRLFALHWRLKNFRVRPSAINFTEFARTAWFGPLDITGLPLVEHDLALAKERIDRADPEELEKANSAAQERHLAINWLWEGPQQFSQVRTDT